MTCPVCGHEVQIRQSVGYVEVSHIEDTERGPVTVATRVWRRDEEIPAGCSNCGHIVTEVDPLGTVKASIDATVKIGATTP